MTFSCKTRLFPFMLALLVTLASSVRFLDEAIPAGTATVPGGGAAGSVTASAGSVTAPVGGAAGSITAPGGGPAGTVTAPGGGASGVATGPGGGASVVATGPGGGASGVATGPGGGASVVATGPGGGAPVVATGPGGGASGVATGPGGGASGVATGPGGGAAAGDAPHPDLTFFMHDILGGSNPTAKAITGIVTNPAVSGQVPFAKPNGAVLPQNNGGPQNNGNNGLLNNNNIPFITGLGGFNPNVMQQNNGNNFIGGNGFPVMNGAQLSAGTTLQQLMFGTMMAIDDELTEGPELASGMVGKAQGFYIYSSVDGKSQTMAFTTMFQEGGFVDSLNFFGVHQTAVSESWLAVMGGTGKFVNAKGFALVKTLPPVDQHETDGLETVLQLSVFLTY